MSIVLQRLMQGKRRGRPPKEAVDPDLAAGICKNLELAMPIALAAEAEGVGRRTVYEWMAKFEDFSAQITRARARGARKLVRRALEGGKGSWTAARLLERRYFADYGKRRRDEQRENETIEIIVNGGLGPFSGDAHS